MLRERHAERPLLCLPTGAGKTTVAAEVIRSAASRWRRSIFLVHRRELVSQAVARLEQFGLSPGVIAAGWPEQRDRQVQVSCIPSLVRRDHWPADVVIVDECAHAISESWNKVLNRYSESCIIGLTATPCRLDGRGLGDQFGCIIEPVTTQELVDQGHLIAPRVFAPPVDLTKLPKRGGDYALPDLYERMVGLTASITDMWMKHAQGMKTVAFAVNVDHSQRIVEAFCDLGVNAAHIDGGTANRERDAALSDLRSGALDLVSNCMVLSEGWDLPDLQCAILARPTKSLALYRQMVGRVMRPPGPVIVLDHAGSHHEHGPVTDEIEWSLDAKIKRAAAPGLRTCVECFAILPPESEVCPCCGAELKQEQDIAPPGVDNPGELVEVTNRRTTKEEKAAYHRLNVKTALDKGYSIGWARYRYKDKFGVWPRLRDVEREAYDCPGHRYTPVQRGPRRARRCEFCYDERPA